MFYGDRSIFHTTSSKVMTNYYLGVFVVYSSHVVAIFMKQYLRLGYLWYVYKKYNLLRRRKLYFDKNMTNNQKIKALKWVEIRIDSAEYYIFIKHVGCLERRQNCQNALQDSGW